jgi:hypothetical protein
MDNVIIRRERILTGETLTVQMGSGGSEETYMLRFALYGKSLKILAFRALSHTSPRKKIDLAFPS